MQLKQNLAPIRNTLSKAMSGGAKAVFNGRSKLNAMWNEFERGTNDLPKDNNASRQQHSSASTSRTSFQSEKSATTTTTPESPSLESTSQQAGRLFSNFSSFLTRKTKEFSQAMEVSNRRNKEYRHMILIALFIGISF